MTTMRTLIESLKSTLNEGYNYHGLRAAEARNAIIRSNGDPNVRFDSSAVNAAREKLTRRGDVDERMARSNAASMAEGLIEIEIVKTHRKVPLLVVRNIVLQMLSDQQVVLGKDEESSWVDFGKLVADRAANHMGLSR